MFDEKYMRRAIELAKKGLGAVNPNPLVGAVIVKEGRIIGEGYHARYGELHAERDAFKNLTEDAAGAQMYVTLEPCCHHGKQPPCVEAIVENKISIVYVGSDDPNEKVSGKGYSYLREHGIKVITHVLKEECDRLNDIFFHYITTKTPYVTMKYAMTLDGKIATITGLSKWISGEKSRVKVHENRNRHMGIMVGIGTVLADDPMLNCRIKGGRNPIRIICDSKFNIPLDSAIMNTAKEIETIIAGCEITEEKRRQLEERGAEVLLLEKSDMGVNLRQLMSELGKRGIDSVFLEGGGSLNYSALAEGIVNEVEVYISPKIFGGVEAVSPVAGKGVITPDEAFMFKLDSSEKIDEDIRLVYKKAEVDR